MSDDRISPSYYKSEAGIECIDVIEIFDLGYHFGNAFKYLTRWRKKNGVEDLKKALWYVERACSQGLQPRELSKFSHRDTALWNLAFNAFGFTPEERNAGFYMILRDADAATCLKGLIHSQETL